MRSEPGGQACVAPRSWQRKEARFNRLFWALAAALVCYHISAVARYYLYVGDCNGWTLRCFRSTHRCFDLPWRSLRIGLFIRTES